MEAVKHSKGDSMEYTNLIRRNDFSFLVKKRIGVTCNLNGMRQSACLVFNPITVDNYTPFFN